MGDSRRFDLFAKLIKRQFPDPATRIADIAGGKGYLQMALYQLGYRNIITFDKRKGYGRRKSYQCRFFDQNVKEEFDILVGMHPDGATDIIIQQASIRQIPLIIVPCCAVASAHAYWGSHNYNSWMSHLRSLITNKYHLEMEETVLPMQGRNIVLIGKP